jgi:hypothetical protein
LENVNIFYGHLKYFTDIWDNLWPFGTFCLHLVIFSGFGIMYQEKSGNPALVCWQSDICSWLGCNWVHE